MRMRGFRAAVMLTVGVGLLVSAMGIAVPALAQEEIATPTPTQAPPTLTPTPTETPDLLLPTSTVTPTLLPPPEGGGRAIVREIAVRAGPNFAWYPLGGIPYNEEIFPIGRDETGNWVAVNWEGGERAIGWVAIELVVWDPDLDLEALPIFTLTTTITPAPETTATNTATDTPEATATAPATETTVPTAASTEAAAAPSLTPSPLPPSATPSAAAAAAAAPTNAPEEAATQAPIAEPPAPEPTVTVTPEQASQIALFGGLGLLGLAVAAYGWRFIAGLAERRRYAGGFVIEECPACQTGTLHMEEVEQRPLGLVRVRRSVRCTVCRSVFRQIRPGTWRYFIDPLINPALAEDYNARQLSDEAIMRLSEIAWQYEPDLPEPVTQSHPTPEEVIAELEARYEAQQEAEEAAAEQEETDPTPDEQEPQTSD